MLSFMLSVTCKPYMLSDIKLSVIRLSVVAPYLDLKLSLCLTSFQISKDNNDSVVAIDIIQKEFALHRHYIN
jgi:hypothetical protein